MARPNTSLDRRPGGRKNPVERLDPIRAAKALAEVMPSPVPVSVRLSARARGVLLRFLPDKGLEVVAPPGLPAHVLAQAVESRREWIEAVGSRLAAEGSLAGGAPRPERLVLTAFGRQWRLTYLFRDRAGCAVQMRGPGEAVVSGAVSDNAAVAKGLAAFCRDRAGTLLRAALADISQEAGLPYAGVSIRAQRTRWGSCTAKGRVSLNFTLAFLPWELCRLVLLHELCHTVELNHSERFWALLARHEPACRELDVRLGAARHYLPLWLRQGIAPLP